MKPLDLEDGLRQLGFTDYTGETMGSEYSLEYDFVKFKIRAGFGNDMFGYAVVIFYSQYRTARTIGFIEFKLSRTVASLEQLKALLSNNLERHLSPNERPAFLIEGLELSDHLPGRENWAEEREKSKIIEDVFIEHDWFKVFAKKFMGYAVKAPKDELTTIFFKNGILKFCCGTTIFSVMGSGKNWERAIIIETNILAKFYNRISLSGIRITYSLNGLNLNGRYFPVLDCRMID